MTKQELKGKLEQFVALHEGKFVEAYDPSNPNQCYDLVTAWALFIGLKPPMTLYAYQIYDNPPVGFEVIENTLEAVVEPGDIVVWSKNYNGTAGHTAVALEGNLNNLMVFTQNDPLGAPSIKRTYSYSMIRGWLRPITNSLPTMDRRPYWFDLMNSVIFKLPFEQVTDQMVRDWANEYPNEKARSGKWGTLVNRVFGKPTNSNPVTVKEVLELVGKAQSDKITILERELAECRLNCQKQKEFLIAKVIALLKNL